MDYPKRRLNLVALTPRPVLEDVTVVIPTLGRPILEACLAWLMAGTAWPGGLVVVDQGRKPQVAAWLDAVAEAGIGVRYVPSEQRGRAAGVNRGIEAVRTRFFCVTDDDCFADASWLARMIEHLRANPLAIVTGRVAAAGEGVISVVSSPVPRVYRRPGLRFDHMSGGNMGASLAVFERVGPFDEDPRVRTAEDGEWAYRALRTGVAIVYAPDACVSHFGWRDEGQRAGQYRDYARSQGGFYGKYLRRGDWFIALRAIVHHGRALRRWVGGVRHGDHELAANGRAYFTGLLPGMVAGIRQGKRG